MPEDKDFLSQFSGQRSHSTEPEPIKKEIKMQSKETKKPESFNHEVRTKVEKKRKQINVPLLVGLIGLLLLLLVGIYFIFLAPKIEMPDFVGQTKNDVAGWVKQQDIEVSGIIFNEEYDFNNDEGVILEQSVEAGKKVKNNVKITFLASKGPDPDELINVPDLESMDKEEIKNWISENKLTKTKLSTQYSDTVEEDQVISYEFSGVEADSFTRSSTLKIVVSKGPQPAGTLTVEDFSKKDVNTVEAWCASKKVEFVKTEIFSDTVAAGLVISQSPEANKLIKEGETISVVVSKGKGIKVPDLTTMTRSDVDTWLKDNGVTASGKYSSSSKYVISQSIAANTTASSEDIAKMKVETNLGSSFYLEDVFGVKSVVGMQYNRLVDLCNELRSTGIDAFAGDWGSNNEEYSYKYSKGQIVSAKYTSHKTGKEYGENDKMPLDLRFNVIVSKGLITKIDLNSVSGDSNDLYNVSELVDLLATNNISFKNDSTSEQCKLIIDGNTVSKEAEFEYIEGQSVILTD